MNYKNLFAKFLSELHHQPKIGGLEVSDSALRFLLLDGKKAVKSSLRLPPGVVVNGRVSDKVNFTAALKKLREQAVGRSKKKLYVVVSLETSAVYVQHFTLPGLPEESVKEAARLNMQMISPINLEDAYYDWQFIGEESADGFQLELLGAFIEKTAVDELAECLNGARFVLAAVEFPALSLARLIKTSGAGANLSEPQAVVSVSSEGLMFLILKNGNLYFQYYEPWQSLYGEKRQITLSSFEEAVKRDLFKVLNFYSTKEKEEIAGVIIAADGLETELGEIIKRDFNIVPKTLSLAGFGNLGPSWHRALGAALRGNLPRLEDKFISLTSVGIQEEFEHSQLLHFISFWRAVVLSSLGFIFIVFVLADVFAAKNLDFYRASVKGAPQLPPARKIEVEKLAGEVAAFNSALAAIADAKVSRRQWSPFLAKLAELAGGGGITIDRVFVQAASSPVVLSGRGKSEDAVINFKNVLNDQPQFENAVLPLAGLTKEPSGEFSFNLTIEIKSLEF